MRTCRLYELLLIICVWFAPWINAHAMTQGPVQYLDSFVLDIHVVPPFCAGQQAMVMIEIIGGTAPYMYSADGGLNFVANPAFLLLGGTYIFTVRDATGCKKDTMVTIPEPPPIHLFIGQDTFTAGVGEVINLLASGLGGTPPLTYMWLPTQGLSCSNCPNPTVVAGMVVSYTVTLSDANGCSRSLSVAIDVTADSKIFVPSAFSPDQDGLNDFFQVYGSGIGVQEVELLQVWGRWGGLIWEGRHFLLNDPAIGWDGTWKGKSMDPGVFAYSMKIRFVDGTDKTYKGEFMLIR